jgi:hypothetical protein
MAPRTTPYQVVFKYFAYAGTADRVRPEDMGLGSYYFGVRLRRPGGVGTWFYKTSAETLSYRQDESLAISVIIDVQFEDNQYVDCPFGIGTFQYELIICSTQCLTWSTSQPGTVYKLPNATIDGVVYINSGSFVVADYLNPSVVSMAFTSSGYTYMGSIISTSASAWIIDSYPSWITPSVYRGGIQVNTGDYVDGDELRLVPNAINSGASRTDTVWVFTSDNSFGRTIEVTQASSSSISYYFNDYDSSGLTFSNYASTVLTDSATSQHITFRIDTGLGAYDVYVWVRIWHVDGSTSWVSTSSKDGDQINLNISCSSSLVHGGGVYSIDVTKTDPDL